MPRGRNPYPSASPYEDRHGKIRWRYRRKGCKAVALPSGGPGDPAFRDAYEAAVAGATPVLVGASRTKPGTFDALLTAYYQASDFTGIRGAATRRSYRIILEKFRAEYGTLRVRHLQQHHVRKMLDKRAATPAAANNFLKRLRALMAFAVKRQEADHNPTLGIKPLPMRQGGWHTWTDDELDQFRAAHPYGTRARLAFALMLCFGQRGRSDARRMGRQHVKNGYLVFTATKNGAELSIPIDDELQRAIDAMPLGNLTFLTTSRGQPFTPDGFGNWFADQVKAAGLPQRCVAHGLRKAAGRQLAERGATEKEIGAFLGDDNPRAAAVYTKAASQKLLAQSAVDKRRGAKREQELANQGDRFANDKAKSLERKQK